MRVPVAISCFFLIGCDPSANTTTCPIPPTGKTLLEDAVIDVLLAADYTAEHSFGMERGLALNLLAGQGVYVVLFLADEGVCRGPAVWKPDCESMYEPSLDPFFKTRDFCFRSRCEKADIDLVDVYWTERPRTDPDDRHAFSYSSKEPPGQVLYDPNPLVTYRVDLTSPATTVVSADIRHAVTVTLATGERLDLSHTGSVIVKKGPAIDSISFVLFFTGFTPPSSPIIVNVEIDNDNHVVVGDVKLGTEVLGSIDSSFPPISWQGKCASAP